MHGKESITNNAHHCLFLMRITRRLQCKGSLYRGGYGTLLGAIWDPSRHGVWDPIHG